MRVEVDQRDGLTARDLGARSGQAEQHATRDRMVTTDRDQARAGIRRGAGTRGDAVDAGLVIHCLGQRHVAEIADAHRLEGVDAIGTVRPAVMRADPADGTRSQVLVALRRAVAGRVRDAEHADVAVSGILVVWGAEERRDAPPVEGLELFPNLRVRHGRLLAS